MKNLRIAILILTLSVYDNTVNAQDKCKYDIDKKDPFSNKPVRSIKIPIQNLAFLGFNWQLFLNKIGDDYNIETALVLPDVTNDFLEKGDSIMFKLENGQLVTCYARERITPKPVPAGTGKVLTAYQAVVYPISAEMMKIFTTSPVTHVQMNTGAKMYRKEMGDRNAKKLIASAACIMQ